MATFYVRLKPYQRNKGFTVRTYGFRGFMFHTGRWYKIDSQSLARELSKLHQRLHDDASPMLFDVTDEEGAKAIEQKERYAQRFGVSKATAAAPQRSMVAGGKPGRATRGRPPKVSVEPELTTALLSDEEEPELTEEEILEGFEDDVGGSGKLPPVAVDGEDEGDGDEDGLAIEEVGKIELDEDQVTDAPDAEDVVEDAPAPKKAEPPPARLVKGKAAAKKAPKVRQRK